MATVNCVGFYRYDIRFIYIYPYINIYGIYQCISLYIHPYIEDIQDLYLYITYAVYISIYSRFRSLRARHHNTWTVPVRGTSPQLVGAGGQLLFAGVGMCAWGLGKLFSSKKRDSPGLCYLRGPYFFRPRFESRSIFWCMKRKHVHADVQMWVAYSVHFAEVWNTETQCSWSIQTPPVVAESDIVAAWPFV